MTGGVMSWTVIGPVRKIDRALDTLADGDFTARVEVPNATSSGTYLPASIEPASI